MLALDINADTIEKAITDAVLGSTLGKVIKEILEDATSGYKFKEKIKDVIFTIAASEASKIIREQHTETIRKAVAETMSDKTVKKILSKVADQISEGLFKIDDY